MCVLRGLYMVPLGAIFAYFLAPGEKPCALCRLHMVGLGGCRRIVQFLTWFDSPLTFEFYEVEEQHEILISATS